MPKKFDKRTELKIIVALALITAIFGIISSLANVVFAEFAKMYSWFVWLGAFALIGTYVVMGVALYALFKK